MVMEVVVVLSFLMFQLWMIYLAYKAKIHG
jgi:hypothetical protein